MSLIRNSTFKNPQIENEFQYLFENCDFENVNTYLRIKNGNYLMLYSPDNTKWGFIQYNGSDMTYETTDGGHLFLGGKALYTYDSNNTNSIKFGHDDTDGYIYVNSGDLYLWMGSGNVKFGTHSALAGESLSGYITIKDSSGNSRKLGVVS